MRALCFLAERFAWTPHSPSPHAVPGAAPGEARDALVAFLSVEPRDLADEAHAIRACAKHLKWMAGKRGLTRAVLHSFAHLGGEPAEPARVVALLEALAARLRAVGYEVLQTPFGYSCAWELAVFGEPLAKVWKEL